MTAVVAWVVLVAALVTLWARFGAAADNTFTGSGPGQPLLSEHFPRQSGGQADAGDPLGLLHHGSRGGRARQAGSRRLREGADVTGVAGPYTTPGHVSADGHIAYATVQFSVQGSGIPGSEVTALMDDATKASGNGVTFSLGGDVVGSAETPYGGPYNGIGIGAAGGAARGVRVAAGTPLAARISPVCRSGRRDYRRL